MSIWQVIEEIQKGVSQLEMVGRIPEREKERAREGREREREREEGDVWTYYLVAWGLSWPHFCRQVITNLCSQVLLE